MLFTTPYIGYSFLLSALYIFTLGRGEQESRRLCRHIPLVETRNAIEFGSGRDSQPAASHSRRETALADHPGARLVYRHDHHRRCRQWKDGCGMYPFTDQLLGYRAADREAKASGLVLEVKGDFCHKVREILSTAWPRRRLHRNQPGFRVGLQPASQRPGRLRSGLRNRFLIEQPVRQGQGTLLAAGVHESRQIHHHPSSRSASATSRCSMSMSPPSRRKCWKERCGRPRRTSSANPFLLSRGRHSSHMRVSWPKWASKRMRRGQLYRVPDSAAAREVLQKLGIEPTVQHEAGPGGVDPDRKEQLDSVKRWYNGDWKNLDKKLQTSIVEGISVFLSLFDDNPRVKRTFCPPAELYRDSRNAGVRPETASPDCNFVGARQDHCAEFSRQHEPRLGTSHRRDAEDGLSAGRPESDSPNCSGAREGSGGLSSSYATNIKHFATVGENEPSGDEKFLPLSRQAKCIPIVATQSISSLKSTLPGETWRTLLQTFRTKDLPGPVGRLLGKDCQRPLRPG